MVSALGRSGYAPAQVSLGVLYQKGRGVTQNFGEAMNYYRAAAAQGNANAMYDIGTLFENGQGVETNVVEAARWYLRSAERGSVVGAYDVAEKYELGQGVQKSNVEAWAWFGVAAAGGYRDAAERREAIGPRLTFEQIREATRLRGERLPKK